MPIEHRKEGDALVWVRNPFTGHVTYFTHVHKKRSGFSRQAGARAAAAGEPAAAATYAARLRAELEDARRSCAFCPGNEALTPPEVLHVRARQVFPERHDDAWLIRVVPNLIPRIPECCTGGRNESYVVVEDPRHFADDARGHDDLLCTAMFPLRHFLTLLDVDVEVARRAYANPAVRAVLIRKNQGRESGASQPHVHNQVIGADMPFATIAQECAATAANPRIWTELIDFARAHGFLLEEREGCYAYFCPFGTFPRSYDIVCPSDWARTIDVPVSRWHVFGALLHKVLNLLGPVPLDYEIHEGPGVPLHAHVNARHFAYSNIGGTLNLPSSLVSPSGG